MPWNDDAHGPEEPELADMSWSPFGQRLMQHDQTITSFQCFHTGTTTSVKRSTIRTTMKGHNVALVMEADSGEYFVALTKAQGCDEEKVGDPFFVVGFVVMMNHFSVNDGRSLITM